MVCRVSGGLVVVDFCQIIAKLTICNHAQKLQKGVFENYRQDCTKYRQNFIQRKKICCTFAEANEKNV